MLFQQDFTALLSRFYLNWKISSFGQLLNFTVILMSLAFFVETQYQKLLKSKTQERRLCGCASV